MVEAEEILMMLGFVNKQETNVIFDLGKNEKRRDFDLGEMTRQMKKK